MWGKWEKLSSTAGRAILAQPAQHADAPHAFALLRARRERPCHRAAEQRDELASPHSITSSARASSVGGMVRPSALAVIRLMTRSNLVGCSTGKSAGFALLRMRPAYAKRRGGGGVKTWIANSYDQRWRSARRTPGTDEI